MQTLNTHRDKVDSRQKMWQCSLQNIYTYIRNVGQAGSNNS